MQNVLWGTVDFTCSHVSSSLLISFICVYLLLTDRSMRVHQEEEQRLASISQHQKQGLSLGSITSRFWRSKQQWAPRPATSHILRPITAHVTVSRGRARGQVGATREVETEGQSDHCGMFAAMRSTCSVAHQWPHPLSQMSEVADWLKIERMQVRFIICPT